MRLVSNKHQVYKFLEIVYVLFFPFVSVYICQCEQHSLMSVVNMYELTTKVI